MAADPVVAIVGVKALSKDINKLTDDVRGPLFKAIQAAGKAAADPVAAATRSALPTSDRPNVPGAGQLAASVRTSGTRTGAAVRMGTKRVPWAGWVEFGGTRHKPFQSSRPFVKDGRYMFPSARSLAERSEQLYSTAMSKVFATSGVWTNPGDTAHD
jgi:hypothetical protein